MNCNGRSSWVLASFLFLVAGALITPAYGESPIVITPFQWNIWLEDLGASESANFTVQNGEPVPSTPVYGGSPIVITPFQWYTGVTDLGASKSANFTVQNGGPVPLVIGNIRLRTASSCFSVSPLTPLPATLAPSEGMQVVITFSAQAEGLQRASIEVDYTQIMP